MAELFTSSAVAFPSLLMPTRRLPGSPRRTICPLASASCITSTMAYNTARMSAPLTVLIFSMDFGQSVKCHLSARVGRGIELLFATSGYSGMTSFDNFKFVLIIFPKLHSGTCFKTNRFIVLVRKNLILDEY